MKKNKWIVWLSLSFLFLATSCMDIFDFDQIEGRNVEIKDLIEGSTVEVLAEAKPGFVFSHWLQNGEIVSMVENYVFVMPGSDIKLVAVFTKK